MILPIEFTDNMRSQLGGEFDAFLAAMGDEPQAGLRANRLKISPGEPEGLLGRELTPVPWCAEGFYMPPGFRAGKSPLYHAGLYYIQEPSAMSAAAALDPRPGERVLDLCAAPGGKSTQLAGMMGGAGLLVCNDISRSRLKALVKNLELAGVANAVVTCEEPQKLAGAFPNFFDKILLDAPCSGEGMFRKDADVRKAWSAEKPGQFAAISRGLLDAAARMLAPGGRILFSTCTFNCAENEDSVDGFLAAHADFFAARIELGGAEAFAPGYGTNGAYYRRLFPHKLRGEGHFLALLEKEAGGGERAACRASASLKPAANAQRAVFAAFARETLAPGLFADAQLYAMGDTLFTLPADMPNLDGIRVVKTGLRLGETHKNRFEPSQALAMALTRRDVIRTADFPRTSPEAAKYLKGETLSLPQGSADGMTLVCTQGHPLGWGKALGGTLKNKYMRAWLMN
ncbi:MAG: RsmB/NOP family class I SAM-dependent RNA methyltransferase [Defluviitaleaceae bacterium]|nr:RsmB/NOP family class I SAM-dependent RNA methyltransferase [Defluviitaleaceae bacterium]